MLANTLLEWFIVLQGVFYCPWERRQGSCKRHTLAPLTAGARHCRPPPRPGRGADVADDQLPGFGGRGEPPQRLGGAHGGAEVKKSLRQI